MRRPLFDPNARKQTVSLSINADLVAKSKELGINISKLAEEALARQFTEQMKEKIREEIREEMAWIDALTAEHGSFGDAVREHNSSHAEAEEDAAAV
jgi:post-segregation antitoxin (ccd killing protein)